VLNSEDTEIPCNGDILFPTEWHPSSAASLASRSSQDAGKPNSLFVKELISNKKSGVPVVVHRDLDNPRQPRASSQMTRLQVMPERGLLHPAGDHVLKFELPSSEATHRGGAGFSSGGSTQFNSADTEMETLVTAKVKEETTDTPLVKHMSHDPADSLTEKLDFVSDCFTYPQTNVSAVKQAEDAPAGVQNHQASHMKVGSSDIAASELVENHSISDPAEPPIQSDDDVPYFSDIEAMVTMHYPSNRWVIIRFLLTISPFFL
jgi:microspherule protein 1